MLIKIKKDRRGKWKLFDNVESVDYDNELATFFSFDEIKQLSPPESNIECHFVLFGVDVETISKDSPVKAAVIRFTRREMDKTRRDEATQCVVVFNTITYICNDTGKTVEKVVGSDRPDDWNPPAFLKRRKD